MTEEEMRVQKCIAKLVKKANENYDVVSAELKKIVKERFKKVPQEMLKERNEIIEIGLKGERDLKQKLERDIDGYKKLEDNYSDFLKNPDRAKESGYNNKLEIMEDFSVKYRISMIIEKANRIFTDVLNRCEYKINGKVEEALAKSYAASKQKVRDTLMSY